MLNPSKASIQVKLRYLIFALQLAAKLPGGELLMTFSPGLHNKKCRCWKRADFSSLTAVIQSHQSCPLSRAGRETLLQ